MSGPNPGHRDAEAEHPKTDAEVDALIHRAAELLDELRSTFAEIKAVLRADGVQ